MKVVMLLRSSHVTCHRLPLTCDIIPRIVIIANIAHVITFQWTYKHLSDIVTPLLHSNCSDANLHLILIFSVLFSI